MVVFPDDLGPAMKIPKAPKSKVGTWLRRDKIVHVLTHLSMTKQTSDEL
jgi:hypothetical protein